MELTLEYALASLLNDAPYLVGVVGIVVVMYKWLESKDARIHHLDKKLEAAERKYDALLDRMISLMETLAGLKMSFDVGGRATSQVQSMIALEAEHLTKERATKP